MPNLVRKWVTNKFGRYQIDAIETSKLGLKRRVTCKIIIYGKWNLPQLDRKLIANIFSSDPILKLFKSKISEPCSVSERPQLWIRKLGIQKTPKSKVIMLKLLLHVKGYVSENIVPMNTKISKLGQANKCVLSLIVCGFPQFHVLLLSKHWTTKTMNNDGYLCYRVCHGFRLK